MRKPLSYSCFVILMCVVQPAKADWSGFTKITDNYFEGTPGHPIITLDLKDPVHSCGTNNRVDILLDNVSSENFQMMAAVVTTAIATGRSIAVYVSGCFADRANITAVKLGS
ncbi:hypothetical protein [Nitrospirillum sp. BR 11163]|uniref:hypothetical protein n=1 Tax=Nitrospirillum sp. BR 11163 TaxID=3104323 RepID=UPI002B000A67|nr:hypothetical protein [Nitrospirillum sp. BR 11163]MEA1674692.1 hypothetical protein [Nitrospirillum sp. BR 11163]